MESILRLFNALPIQKKEVKQNNDLLKRTIKLGFIFAPEIIANYTNYEELINLVEKIYGISAEKLNSSFHKSWQKIKNAPIEQLIIEQIMHYFTTYGFEALGIDSDYVYIPDEILDIPESKKERIGIVVIRGYIKSEIEEKLFKLLNSGIALSEKTVNDVVDVCLYIGIDADKLELIKNKETKIMLYDYLDIIPSNPIEFLRFIIYKVTQKTLIIKSPVLITAIKSQKNLNVIKHFEKYEREYGLSKLAEIFYRFKPLFLAFRTNTRLKIVVNQIRRLARKYHKPIPEDFLNTLTAKIKNNRDINLDLLETELNRVNVFRKIRLAYALKFRTKNVDSILYRIRNGKGYATDFDFENKNSAEKILNIVLKSIIKDIGKNVKNKKIYIPDYIKYTLPATEKQFTGNFPSGTFVEISNDMIFGIHWDDVENERIDLDLSIISSDGKFGWDSNYRNEDRSILFSGDMTEARKPNGATELFYVKKQDESALILFVNYYNFDEKIEVPFKIVVAKEKVIDFKKNYIVNPNNIVAISNTSINQKQKILGLVVMTTNQCRFYFAETNIGKSITSKNDEFTEHSKKYLFDFYENTINLNDILIMAGAVMVDKKDAEIDLSPDILEKDTVLKLLL